jgi:hypothetical protein
MIFSVLLIIVGAGASYDSDWRRPTTTQWSRSRETELGIQFRPPLAAQLFDEQRFGQFVARYAPSQGLMHQLRAAPEVEPELERIRDLSKVQTHLERQLRAVRYYLRDVIEETVRRWNQAMPDEMTNFTRLLTGLEHWRSERSRKGGSTETVAIVTFNYDTLFDEALTNILPAFPLRKVGDYTSDPRYKLFKLHGSVNWWREITPEWDTHGGISSPPTGWAHMIFDPPGRFYENGEFHVGAGGYPPCVPCLALPMATKALSDFACPESNLVDLRLGVFPKVTDVLIIGWKGFEAHFLQEWRIAHANNPQRKIHSLAVVDVNHNEAAAVAQRVANAVGLSPGATPVIETFSGFVNDKLEGYLRETLGA